MTWTAASTSPSPGYRAPTSEARRGRHSACPPNSCACAAVHSPLREHPGGCPESTGVPARTPRLGWCPESWGRAQRAPLPQKQGGTREAPPPIGARHPRGCPPRDPVRRAPCRHAPTRDCTERSGARSCSCSLPLESDDHADQAAALSALSAAPCRRCAVQAKRDATPPRPASARDHRPGPACPDRTSVAHAARRRVPRLPASGASSDGTHRGPRAGRRCGWTRARTAYRSLSIMQQPQAERAMHITADQRRDHPPGIKSQVRGHVP